MMDSYRSGEQCIAYMAAPEIRTAAFIGFDNNSRAERKMEAGFMVGCRSRNIRVKEDWNVYLGCSSYENGYGAAREVLSKIELPSAWLVADSRLAGGIMDYCQDNGIRVPEDVRIILLCGPARQGQYIQRSLPHTPHDDQERNAHRRHHGQPVSL